MISAGHIRGTGSWNPAEISVTGRSSGKNNAFLCGNDQMSIMKRLLLLSNSTNAGEAYLGWPRPFISDFLKGTGVRDILFIPYAGVNLVAESVEASYDAYEKRVDGVFRELGYGIY
jgi:hypothetical protein